MKRLLTILAVKYFDKIIAVDLIDFINKMMVNPNYFI